MSSSNDGVIYTRNRHGVMLRLKIAEIPAPAQVPLPLRLLAPDAVFVPAWVPKLPWLPSLFGNPVIDH